MVRETRKMETPDPAVIEMRRSLAQRIAAHTKTEGEYTTAVPGLILYHRTSPTPCYRASYEPSLTIFVQGRKRITLGGTEYLCDGSSFLLSSIDVPAQSQIVRLREGTVALYVSTPRHADGPGGPQQGRRARH